MRPMACGMSAAPPIAPEIVHCSDSTKSAIRRPEQVQQTASLLDGLGSFHVSRQPDRKGGPAPRLALDHDVAAHHLTEAFADREAEAGSAVFTGRRRRSLRKFLEQLPHLFRRHPDAGIGNRDRNPIAALLLSVSCIDADGAALG